MKQVLTYTIVLLLGSFYTLQAQMISIPDANFEAKLISLGIDSDGTINGQVSTSDTWGIYSLDLRSSNISDLTGVEFFPSLRSIFCDSNQITTIDVSNTNLTTLWCHSNQATSIILPSSGTMESFICYDNALTTLDVSGQPNLINFNCSDNQLSTLNISNNPAITLLYCDSNNLTTIDVSNNSALFRLGFSNNQVTNINLTNNLNLAVLDAHNNPLNGSLNISNNTRLTHLTCNNTGLSTLDLSNHTALSSLVVHSNQLSSLDLLNHPDLRYLDAKNNQLDRLNLSGITSLSYLHCEQNQPDLRICLPSLNLINGFWTKDVTAIYTTGCGDHTIMIQTILDSNLNCLADSTEPSLGYQIVKLERQSDGLTSYFSTYDSTTGMHPFYVDTGSYLVSIVDNHPYWQVCPSSQILTIDTNLTQQTVTFAIQPIINCPFLEVDISAPFLRMAAGGSAYTISYCNTGPATAVNAYVEVDLDGDLNYVGASIPLISQVANRYRFNLGNIPSGTCGSFNIQVVVDTSALFGQTHCSRVHIYPDSLCLPPFNLPLLTGETSCQNDTVFFTLENKGASMIQPQKYDIFEDNIAMRTSTVQLNSGQSIVIAQAADTAKTYRLQVEQAPNFPPILGDSILALFVEGCHPRPDGSFNTGFITQFSNGLSQPTEAIDCQQSIAAYDPNDKSAQPLGYDAAHYIYANTAIDYKVRFQNTGNDTAFTVIILDTLSPLVDPSTLTMGASSHTYNWSIQNSNVLRVDFPNIKLVDSTTNEPLSHGFFRYRIEQQANNPLGSVIYNQAAIYFDYNPPIFTNTTFHTIEEDFVTAIYLSVDQVYDVNRTVVAFPNPFKVATTIRVEEETFDLLELQVFDLLGRAVWYQQAYSSNQVEMQRGNLEQGIYIYQLIGDGTLLSTGKVKVE